MADEVGPVTPEQAEKALELIRTGDFSEDVAGSLDTVLDRINPSLVAKVIRSLPKDELNSTDLITAVAADLSDTTNEAKLCLAHIFKGDVLKGKCKSSADNPKLLRNTYSGPQKLDHGLR
jgi:hypothetical protein